jgi:NodT family efflux transporter outer membrane factor (OMF) lipoprotein
MPQTKPAASYETARSFTAPTGAWPSDDWWKAYGDPQLDQLIEEALAGSPDLKIAAARVRGAEAVTDITGANLWPTVVGGAGVQETEQTLNNGFPAAFKPYLPRGWHHAAQISAGFEYQLDFFGKNRAALAAATSDAQAAKAEEAEARLQISTAVAATYAVLEQLFADQQAAKDALRVRQESVALVEQRWKSGLENEASLSQARALMHAAEVESDTFDRLTALTRNQLAALMGKGPDRGLSIVPIKAHQLRSAGLPTSLAVDLIGRRPDVVAARLGAEAAASRIDVANANFYPNVDLTGLYGLQTLDIKYLAQGSSAMGAFGPAIHLPIFDYGRNTGIYRGARAQYDAAVAVYDKTLTGALHEVADAYANQRGLAAELKDAHASLAESENAYRIVRLRYDAGLSRYLDVLTAENLLLQQRRAVTDLESQAFAYDVALVCALGGGFTEKN